ncbi:hypothetical protein AVEN_157006-1, partial [Araneus ventricosus]
MGLLKYMVNMRSETKIFEYADLLALLAELKNEQEEMTKGQERMEVQEEMKDRFRTSQEKMKRQFQAHIESQIQFDVVSSINGWTNFVKASQLIACLRGSVVGVLQGIPADKLMAINTIEKALEARFGDRHLIHGTELKTR